MTKTITDAFESYIGTTEYNGIVATIQKWYYGTLVKASWCATSCSYFADQVGVLSQLGGKNENVYLMMKAAQKTQKSTGKGTFYMRSDIPKNFVIPRGTVVFMLTSGTVMTEGSKKHVTTVYENFTYKGSGYWKGLGGNQSDSIKVSQYTQSTIYAIFIPTYSGSKPTPTPTPTPSTKKENVMAGQKWLNENYGDIIKKYWGALLDIDGSYGSKTRRAALTVWKDLMNRKYGTKLDPGNSNFYDTSKAAAKNAVVKTGTSGTFTYIAQLILSARGYYAKAMDGECGSGTTAAIKSYQKAKGLTVDGHCGPATWFSLFN